MTDPEIVLPYGTQYVTVGEIPNLIAYALYPEPIERFVNYLMKVQRGSMRTLPLTPKDWEYLSQVWSHLPAYSDGMPESKWRPYAHAFDTAPDKPYWQLVAFEKDGPLARAVMRADAEKLHKDALEKAIRSGVLVARTHALTEASSWDGTLPSARILIDDLIEYTARIPVGVRVQSAPQFARNRFAAQRSTIGGVARALTDEIAALRDPDGTDDGDVRADIKAAIIETRILGDIQKLSDDGVIAPRMDEVGTRAVRPCTLDTSWYLTRVDLERVIEYTKCDEDSKRDYLKQVLSHRTRGRYTLRQAAEFIELEGGENYKSILERLTTAALNDELPMYLPGENLRHDYGPKPRKRLCVRDFYDQTYWNDLNAWLVQYEPRITCQFPQPSSQPPPDGRAGSTGTESHICSTATRVPKERPLKQRVYQEEEVLRAIRELGHDPMALPKGARGRPGVKKEARSLLSQFSRSIFDKTWMRLRSTGRLAP